VVTPNTQQTQDPPEEFREPTLAELRANVVELEQALELTLSDQQRRLLHQLQEAEADERHRQQSLADGRFADALARHFPGLEPAIRTVARHAWTAANDFEPERRRCNLVRDDASELMLSWCDEPDGAA
jgi:hypothetical protein